MGSDGAMFDTQNPSSLWHELMRRDYHSAIVLIEMALLHAAQKAASERDAAREETEQHRVQLAGCSAVAMGATAECQLAHRGMYGWSPTYDDVLRLRRESDAMRAVVEAARKVQAGFTEPEIATRRDLRWAIEALDRLKTSTPPEAPVASPDCNLCGGTGVKNPQEECTDCDGTGKLKPEPSGAGGLVRCVDCDMVISSRQKALECRWRWFNYDARGMHWRCESCCVKVLRKAELSGAGGCDETIAALSDADELDRQAAEAIERARRSRAIAMGAEPSGAIAEGAALPTKHELAQWSSLRALPQPGPNTLHTIYRVAFPALFDGYASLESRLREAEREYGILHKAWSTLLKERDAALARVESLKTALKFYADGFMTWPLHPVSEAERDRGEVARVALAHANRALTPAAEKARE